MEISLKEQIQAKIDALKQEEQQKKEEIRDIEWEQNALKRKIVHMNDQIEDIRKETNRIESEQKRLLRELNEVTQGDQLTKEQEQTIKGQVEALSKILNSPWIDYVQARICKRDSRYDSYPVDMLLETSMSTQTSPDGKTQCSLELFYTKPIVKILLESCINSKENHHFNTFCYSKEKTPNQTFFKPL